MTWKVGSESDLIHSGSLSLPGAGNPCSVQTPGRLLRVSPVVHLNEGEAGGPASHPHVLHYAVLAKGVLQVIAISVLGKAPWRKKIGLSSLWRIRIRGSMLNWIAGYGSPLGVCGYGMKPWLGLGIKSSTVLTNDRSKVVPEGTIPSNAKIYVVIVVIYVVYISAPAKTPIVDTFQNFQGGVEDLAVSYISATAKTPILYIHLQNLWLNGFRGFWRSTEWNGKNGSTVHHIGTGSDTSTLIIFILKKKTEQTC